MVKRGNKIGVVGDIHMRENLGYADYVEDGREAEKKEILDFIVENLKDCSDVVFMGDQLNSKTNPPQVLKEFVSFIERFDDKNVYILAGNHEKNVDKCALDFLSEIKNKHWVIVKDSIIEDRGFVFCPYFSKTELEESDNKKATKKLMQGLIGEGTKGKILFVHHSISDSISTNGIPVSIFDEIVLPRKELEKEYKFIVGGHIHNPQTYGKVIVAGSIINNEVNEPQKYVWKIDTTSLDVEKIALPGRLIISLKDPAPEELEKIETKNIVKVIITKKDKLKSEDLREKLRRFDGYIVVEEYPSERKKTEYQGEKSILDLTIQELLELYAKTNKVDIERLLKGFELINQ